MPFRTRKITAIISLQNAATVRNIALNFSIVIYAHFFLKQS